MNNVTTCNSTGRFMPTYTADLTGECFGRLTAVRYIGNVGKTSRAWECKCTCGKLVVVAVRFLISGIRKSCGCQRKDSLKTHAMAGTRPYGIWSNMVTRCTKESDKEWHNYGGRGIKVCEQWRQFAGFWADMNVGYADNLTLDRIDPNKGYEPFNCRWATLIQQGRNRRNNRILYRDGEAHCVSEWAEILSIPASTLFCRLHKGWSDERSAAKSCGCKPKVEKMPNGKDAKKGYEAFLEKFGLKKEKWRGFRATGKRKTGEQ